MDRGLREPLEAVLWILFLSLLLLQHQLSLCCQTVRRTLSACPTQFADSKFPCSISQQRKRENKRQGGAAIKEKKNRSLKHGSIAWCSHYSSSAV
jgi:hypothetical protein